MAEGTATDAGWLPEKGSARHARRRLGLQIVWSQGEPGRVGEVALAPAGGKLGLVGRGAPRGDDDGERMLFQRLRPGRAAPRLPLEASVISRRHLLVTHDDGQLLVQCVGKVPMLVAGRAVERARLLPGDLLQIERQVLLLCVERRGDEFSTSVDEPPFAFGEADAFGLVGESPRAWQLRDELAFFARRAGHVLIQGPSGAGKELCARALHGLSERHAGPFLSRNAATLPPGIIDAELFGNARNYPNAGMRERAGMVGEADGGTLFLDEIGELPVELQAHLLRLLDGGEYHRLGEELPRRSDVRVIAATNRDDGSLKHDLLARLKLRLQVPGLDERRDDIPLIIRAILRRIARDDAALRARFFEGNEARLAPDLVHALLRHRYLTHVRELESLLLSAMAESREHFIALTPAVERRLRLSLPAPPPAPDGAVIVPSAAEVEAALERHQGNVSQAWRALGLSSRDALNRLLKKYNLAPRRP